MSVGGIGSSSALQVQTLITMRRQLADLQRQLGTGRKADNYADLGPGRGLAMGLRGQLAAIGSFGDAIKMIGVRLEVAQSALGDIDAAVANAKRAIGRAGFDLDQNGLTTEQATARRELDRILAGLNTQFGDQYIFSGRSADKPAVVAVDPLLQGGGTRAGLTQIIAERRQADCGADGLGRLVLPAAAGTVVAMAEDAAPSPFGLKLGAVTSTLAGATVTGPAGSPPALSVDLGAVNPNDGEAVTFSFTLPDGSSENVTLTATASATPGPGQFAIGATSAATAANLQAALTAAVGQLADTSLAAASAITAADDFFDIDAAHPPQRVAGPPFATATALVDGTDADTMLWYTGEAGSDPARATAAARVDSALTVSYGLRANEAGLREPVAAIAVFSALSFSPADANGAARYAALRQRLESRLAAKQGTQTVADIRADVTRVQTTMAAAKERHDNSAAALTDLLDSTEGVRLEEVAAQMLSLQTSLQASLQTTALLSKVSLVNYL